MRQRRGETHDFAAVGVARERGGDGVSDDVNADLGTGGGEGVEDRIVLRGSDLPAGAI